MKSSKVFCIIFLLAMSLICVQAEEDEERLKSIIGLKFGVSYYSIESGDFNKIYQEISPNNNITYYPVISQFGISSEQLMKLGNTNHNFSLQNILLFGGIDKSIVIVTASESFGIRFEKGLLLGFGPMIIFNDQLTQYEKTDDEYNYNSSSGIVTLTIEYTIEQRFNINGILIPVNLRAMVNPKDNNWRISLLTGLDFEAKDFKFPSFGRN